MNQLPNTPRPVIPAHVPQVLLPKAELVARYLALYPAKPVEQTAR